MKTYQSFAKSINNSQFILTEIRAKNIKEARNWFKNNTFEYEKIYLKTN